MSLPEHEKCGIIDILIYLCSAYADHNPAQLPARIQKGKQICVFLSSLQAARSAHPNKTTTSQLTQTADTACFPSIGNNRKKNGREIPEFDTCAPYTTLSEYLSGAHLNALTACIREASGYDGIIVTHGTDTLQYTAAALGLLFAHSEIPIILVSSNYILDDPRANGLVNFTYAVDCIRTYTAVSGNPVTVSYCNPGQTPALYDALCLNRHRPYDDCLCAQAYEIRPDRSDIQPSMNLYRFSDPCPVYYMRAVPGQTFPVAGVLPPHIRAILIETYHSGTLDTSQPSFRAMADSLHQKNIPVYLTGISKNSADYESKKLYAAYHLNILPEYSPIAAYMLLWMLYGFLYSQ